jgi:hypothetical protein
MYKEEGLSATHPSLIIFDEFNGQTTDSIFKLLEENNIYYVRVPPNTTDQLQPMDLSVNKSAKDFLRCKFQTWYAEKIASQMTEVSIQPVDLRLSVMKPIGAKWLIDMFDYFKAQPNIIKNGFCAAGITQWLTD